MDEQQEDTNNPREIDTSNDTENEERGETENEATLDNSQKRLYKVIAATVGGIAGAGSAISIASSGGLSVCIPFIASGFMTFHSKFGKSGKIPLVSRWLDRSVSNLENKVNDPNIEEEQSSKLTEKLQKRQAAMEIISDCTRPFFVGATIGLLFGGISGVASSGMLEKAMVNTYGPEAADNLSWMGNESLARGASAAAGAATVPLAEAGQRMREWRNRNQGN